MEEKKVVGGWQETPLGAGLTEMKTKLSKLLAAWPK